MSKKNNNRLMKKCQICNNKAVGFHYGAYVCEACKKFFVRHASGVCRLYGTCQEKGQCDLNIDGRGKCQHCRYNRCIEIGMNIDSKSSDYDLTAIPCQVCGSKSSGLHFGCITCEGCKGFFRRMIKCKGSLACFNDNKCKLDLKNRSTCKSCRMNRCLTVGMSRKGIRIGRHTNSLKYTCLNMHKNEQKSDVNMDSTTDNEQIVSVKTENLEQLHLSDSETVDCKTELVNQDETVEDVSLNSVKDNQNIIEIDADSIPEKSDQCIESEILPDCASSESDSKIGDELDCFAETSISKIQNKLSKATIFLTQKKMGFSFGGKSRNVISSNDSIQTVWSIMMDHFVFHSQFIVKFAKLMPGFLQMSHNDKKCIIKDAMYSMILLELSQDHDEGAGVICFNYFDFSAEDRQIILKYFPEFNEFSIHVKNAGMMKFSLGLDKLEITLMCGIMMFYNYNNLDNWMYGKSMILLYQEYLIRYFRSHYNLPESDAKTRLRKCLEFIMVLNEMNIQHQRIIIDFCSNHTELQYPDLYIEVFNH